MNQHRALGPLQVLAAVITAVLVVAGAAIWVWNWYFWYEDEVSKMEQVSVDMPIAALEGMFGPPNKKRPVGEGGYLPYPAPLKGPAGNVVFWKERGYWVLAHEVDEVVAAYQIRVCDTRMKPSVIPYQRYITANETRLGEPGEWPYGEAEYSASAGWYGYFEGKGTPRSLGGGVLHWGVAVAHATGCDTVYGKNSNELGDDHSKWHSIRGARGTREEVFEVDAGLVKTAPDQTLIEETRQSLIINVIGAQRYDAPFPPSTSLAIHPDELAQIN